MGFGGCHFSSIRGNPSLIFQTHGPGRPRRLSGASLSWALQRVPLLPAGEAARSDHQVPLLMQLWRLLAGSLSLQRAIVRIAFPFAICQGWSSRCHVSPVAVEGTTPKMEQGTFCLGCQQLLQGSQEGSANTTASYTLLHLRCMLDLHFFSNF